MASKTVTRSIIQRTTPEKKTAAGVIKPYRSINVIRIVNQLCNCTNRSSQFNIIKLKLEIIIIIINIIIIIIFKN